MENKNNPYCPICDGCGEEGCCSPLHCTQHSDGFYCKTYLNDLKMGYAMNDFFYEVIYNKLNKKLKKEVDEEFEKIYDKIYNNNKPE